MDVGSLISGSSAISKSSLNIWKFTVHILLKPGLENFEHYFASVWDEAQAGIKIAGRNINNLRYADYTTLTIETEEELKGLLMKKESEKAGLKLNIQKTKIMHLVPSLHCK